METVHNFRLGMNRDRFNDAMHKHASVFDEERENHALPTAVGEVRAKGWNFCE